MKTRKSFVLVLSLVCLLPFLKIQVFACRCARFTPCEAFGRAKAVFVGRMLGGTEKGREYIENGVKISYEAGEVTFAVEEIFKGVQGVELKVYVSTMKGTSCEWSGLQRGARYLVYAGGEANRFTISACSPTKEIEAAKDDLIFLRSLPEEGTGGRLSGKVGLDSGEPTPPSLVGITIAVQDEKGKRLETRTNGAGEFEFIGLKPGKYVVEPVWDDAYSVYQPKREAIVADRGCETVYYWVKIDGRISGKVFDAGKRPAEMIVHLVPFDAGEKAARQTGFGELDGKFEIAGVSPGLYLLYVEVETISKDGVKKEPFYYPGVKSREQASVLKLGRGQKLTGLEFQLPAQFTVQTITGRVEWPDGQPAEQVDVLLTEEESAVGVPRLDRWGSTRTLTDEQGRFTLQGFKGITYRIEARNQTAAALGKQSEHGHAEPLRVKLDDDVSGIKLILSRAGLFEESSRPGKKIP